MSKARDRLTPYFDLFDRLGDEELARLADVKIAMVTEVRSLVVDIYDPLREYEKLLEQLDDRQISKLFGMPEEAARIWRLARAPETLSAEARRAAGVLDPIMGADEDDDDDLLIVVDEPAASQPPEGDDEDMDWSDF